jgi:hypothetical protein
MSRGKIRGKRKDYYILSLYLRVVVLGISTMETKVKQLIILYLSSVTFITSSSFHDKYGPNIPCDKFVSLKMEASFSVYAPIFCYL